MINQHINEEAIEDIATRMDLRLPNREALESVATALSYYYGPLRGTPPYEAVIVSATGVGKTYILASAVEYLARVENVRNFAVIAPGRTILEKTVANFTPGHPKSLLEFMDVRPVVITSENFDTASIRVAMDDPDQVKLYIFTVQSLTRPNTKLGRRTHEFREGLGEAFYGHLQHLDDLIVFADEHHCYYGPAFSDTIRNLNPRALIGLTATPHPRTPAEQIIYRYPLAAAVADRLVKTPVIVGRRDERNDMLTQLTDGVRLLELKERAIRQWCSAHDLEMVNPIMLVVAQTIDDAQMYDDIIRSASFMDGRYAEAVLTIHSNAPDDALKQLADVEDSGSPVRLIISVGMLKEGWDVKNVYVLASMRASVSEILTEQTLGRGLRLPFGLYTGIELLDTLEVLAHERYDDLLHRARIMNEQLIDYRIRLVAVQDGAGTARVQLERQEVLPPIGMGGNERDSGTSRLYSMDSGNQETNTNAADGRRDGLYQAESLGGIFVQSMEEHLSTSEGLADQIREMPIRNDINQLNIPVLRMRTISNPFSLADITDLEPFRQLGRRFRQTPDESLRRERVRARIVTDNTGLRRTEVYIEQADDTIYSQAVLLPVEVMAGQLIDAIIHSEVAPERPAEINAADRLVVALLEGMGSDAISTLSGYFDTIRARLVETVMDSASRFARPPQIFDALELRQFCPRRMTKPNASLDRHGEFKAHHPYIGWTKSMYEQVWFDSEPERSMANLLEESEQIQLWVRLHRGDLPILWNSQDNWYHPDFIAVDTDRAHWIVEVKSDRDMGSPDVQAKKEAALRWANHVSLDSKIGIKWGYLLVAERVIHDARGSWRTIKTLAEGNTR